MNLEAVVLIFSLIISAEVSGRVPVLAITSARVYQKRRWILLWAGLLALLCNTMLTLLVSTLVPLSWSYYLEIISGLILCFYALWTLFSMVIGEAEIEMECISPRSLQAEAWPLFWTQFVLVFSLGFCDKTQVSVFVLSVRAQSDMYIVLFGSVLVLCIMHLVSIFSAQLISFRLLRAARIAGAFVLLVYGATLGGFT